MSERDASQCFVGYAPLPTGVEAEDARQEGDVLEDRLALDQSEVLEDDADRTSKVRDLAARNRRYVASVDDDLPLARCLLAKDQAQERRLAGAGGSGQEAELPALNGEADFFERDLAGRITLGDGEELDHRRALAACDRSAVPSWHFGRRRRWTSTSLRRRTEVSLSQGPSSPGSTLAVMEPANLASSLEPSWRDGIPIWEFAHGDWNLAFLGRFDLQRDEEQSIGFLPKGFRRSWLRQIHSAQVVEARPGCAGEGDALVVRTLGTVGTVSTADCVPLVVLRGSVAVAVHAGWRGVVAGVVAAAVARLAAEDGEARAWIGPAIGGCCYEVGDEVARAVVDASDEGAVVPSPGPRPHIDLRHAVATQLRAAGVSRIEALDHCTRCRSEWLSSYRREGERAGRNLTLVWRAR